MIMKIKYLFAGILFISILSCSPKLEDGLYAKVDTNKGEIQLKLTFDQTPVTVANFVSLAEGINRQVDSIFIGKAYYDGLIFHRVIADFMIQGGDPTGTGQGGPEVLRGKPQRGRPIRTDPFFHRSRTDLWENGSGRRKERKESRQVHRLCPPHRRNCNRGSAR